MEKSCSRTIGGNRTPRRDTKKSPLSIPAFSCRGPKARRPARILAQAPCYPSAFRSIRAGPRGCASKESRRTAGFADADKMHRRLLELAVAILPLRSACQGCYGSAQTKLAASVPPGQCSLRNERPLEIHEAQNFALGIRM